ncbi:peptidoglycan DD-metalloendopeptidase family protein [Candidatus Marinimicrobia bacterium]|nr:peptidoglycan DD-metalloendopeptidase family protein [Candidatus Neomarinimicrobiota bacterium]|tara:strand:- start:791 stop:1987 length:1197 start_codon:yes stop_codon:yes gene_type:complete
MKILNKIILLCFFMRFLYPQSSQRDYSEELRYQNDAINKMKKEIEKLSSKLRKANINETTTSKRITNLDEELALVNKLIQSLKKEENFNRDKVNNLKSRIKIKEDELSLLRLRYEQRIINTYLKGRVSDLEKVLSSTSWRQAVYRTQYLKIVSSIEQKMTKEIESILLVINKDKLKLESLLRQSIALKRDKQKQMASLRKMRIKREKELNRIRQDKSALANYMQEKSSGVKQLESIIKKVLEDKARNEREARIRQQQQALKTKEFNLLRGQLPWPTEGRVISKFGKQWNSRLKTTTDNPGIDIKGQPGSSIRSTMSGVVTTITYIRGYGTTIIIDHGGGFYTVYSHVTNIQTQVDSEVRSGDVIAYMGDSGSVNGAKLHFEVWGKGQKLDPEKWLTKK